MTDLLGLTSPETKITETKAPSLSGYPDIFDAKYAIENNFGYGTGLEPYIKAEVARIYKTVGRGKLDEVLNAPTDNTDLTKLENLGLRERVGTIFTQAALASNRSAIATLGFDPTKINLQAKQGPANLGGFYNPNNDKIWINVVPGNESSVVHESIHRGLEMLSRQSPEAKDIIDKLPEEQVVRYMMYKTMGDPEGRQGEIDKKQRDQGKALENSDIAAKVEQLELMVAELHKNNRPRGPR